MFRLSAFENALEKATSNMLLEPDWNSIMQICDMIRQKDITPKTAMQAIKRKLFSTNPNVILYTLQVLESVVKNCGISIHKEVATKEFMIDFREVLKETTNEQIRQKVLELIQIWSHAFRNEPNYHIVKDTYVLMKMEGYNFPMLKENDAMFMTETPPDWIDGETCYNCKTTFTLVQRKHHCRCCGQVFCQKCSSKSSIIPKFGIEREVRVCDDCFVANNKNINVANSLELDHESTKETLYDDDYQDFSHYDTIPINKNTKNGPSHNVPTNDKSSLPFEYLNSPLSKQSQEPPKKTEIEEREEIELALALSASEAESNLAKAAKASKYLYLGVGPTSNIDDRQQQNRTQATNKNTSNYHNAPSSSYYSSVENDMENELARYLDRDYWEIKQKQLSMKSQPPGNISNNITLPSAPEAMTNTNSCPSPTLSNISSFVSISNYQPNWNSNNDAISNAKSVFPKQTNASLAQPNFNNNYGGLAYEKLQSHNNSISTYKDIEEFSDALQNGINIFVKRMQSNASRNRSIVNDSSVQTLFVTLSQLQPKLCDKIRIQEDKRNNLESLQDKISQIKDARAALNALREDFRERERKEAEEIERQKKLQMSQKLQLMRIQKQEYLEYQRQITLQRMGEHQKMNVPINYPYQNNFGNQPFNQQYSNFSQHAQAMNPMIGGVNTFPNSQPVPVMNNQWIGNTNMAYQPNTVPSNKDDGLANNDQPQFSYMNNNQFYPTQHRNQPTGNNNYAHYQQQQPVDQMINPWMHAQPNPALAYNMQSMNQALPIFQQPTQLPVTENHNGPFFSVDSKSIIKESGPQLNVSLENSSKLKGEHLNISLPIENTKSETKASQNPQEDTSPQLISFD
ncbi:hepatocyte growth factor-regulated tyrosine kinase substrate-like isoform X2 [Gordionus sp. m RMFG-2023]|uniref:hepatocyte growth factor-regulated tyrosine kinase substrate-like isoform X2 n=1 Tax=Gordionus sp. m RMFG-2023 TaxID=3053472 RepID=UPI0031FD7A20